MVGRFGSPPSLLSDGLEEELGAAELVSASSWLEEMEEDEEEEEHGGSFFFLTFLMTPVLHLDFLGRL